MNNLTYPLTTSKIVTNYVLFLYFYESRKNTFNENKIKICTNMNHWNFKDAFIFIDIVINNINNIRVKHIKFNPCILKGQS